MATVPVRQDGLTPTGNIPSPSIRGGNSSFGGGAGQVAEATDRLLGFAGQIAEKETQRADEIAFMDMDTEAASRVSEIELRVKSLKGRDAYGAPEIVDKEWTKAAAELEGRATGRVQRDMLNRALQVRRQRLDQDVNAHMAVEGENYEAETTKARIEVAQNEAALHYGDPTRVQAALAEQSLVIDSFAEANGKSPEWVAQKKGQELSSTHRSVISRMLTDGNLKAAGDYLAANKSQIQSDDLAIINAVSVEAARARAFAQEKFETDIYIRAIDKQVTPADLKTMLEGGQIDISFYDHALNRLKQVNDDPRIPALEKSARQVEIMDMFLDMGGEITPSGRPAEEITLDGGLFSDGPSREEVKKFRDYVAGSAGYMTNDEQLNWLMYSQRAADPSIAPKKSVFKAFISAMKSLPNMNTTNMALAMRRGMGVFGDDVTVDQAFVELDKIKLEQTVQQNPLRAKYKIGDRIKTPGGVVEEIDGFDERGFPTFK